MKRFWPIWIVWAVLVLLYAANASHVFDRGSGNWYAVGFIQKPTGQSLWFSGEKEAACNQSLWYTLLSPAGGIGRDLLWGALSIFLLGLGVASTYLLAKRLLKEPVLAAWATLLSFLVADEFAFLSMPLPRHVVFFILAPLGIWLFLESVEKKSKRHALACGGLFALMLGFHTLMAFFFAVSLAAFVAGLWAVAFLKKTKTEWKRAVFHGALVAALGFGLSLPVILPSIQSALGGIAHPVYGDWARWGFEVFGLWIANLSLVFYGKTVLLKFLIVTGLALTGLHFWKNKDNAYLFLASNLLFSFAFLFTPLGTLVARLITPGIFIEQWLWHTAPFAALAAAGVFALGEKARNHVNNRALGKAVFAALVLLVLLPSGIFLWGLFKSPSQNGEAFVGKSTVDYFSDKPEAVVLTDIETGYLLPFLTPAKVHATTLGYIVCPSPKTLERQKASNAFFKKPDPAALKYWNVTYVLLNKKFWDTGLDLHFRKDGWRYPESFDAASKAFEKVGFPAEALDAERIVYRIP